MITPTDAGSATRSRASETHCSRIRRGIGASAGSAARSAVHRSTYDVSGAQLRKRGHVDPRVEPGHDLAGLEVADRGQVARVQTLQQQRPAVRVGPQQQDGAVAVPVLEREVLEVRLVGVDVGVQLQHRALAVGGHAPGTTSEQ